MALAKIIGRPHELYLFNGESINHSKEKRQHLAKGPVKAIQLCAVTTCGKDSNDSVPEM